MINIQAIFPSEYRAIETIKQRNRPYRYMMDEFIKTVIKITDATDYSFLGTLGYIEQELSDYINDDLPEATTGKYELRYRTDSEEIISYYENENTPNTQITSLLVQLMIKLGEATDYSIPKMIYLLEQLYTDITQDKEMPKSQNKVKQKTDEPSGIKIVKRKEPVSNRKVKTVQSQTITQKNKPEVKPDKEIDNFTKRVANLEKELTGEPVPTNPLLNDFYEY